MAFALDIGLWQEAQPHHGTSEIPVGGCIGQPQCGHSSINRVPWRQQTITPGILCDLLIIGQPNSSSSAVKQTGHNWVVGGTFCCLRAWRAILAWNIVASGA